MIKKGLVYILFTFFLLIMIGSCFEQTDISKLTIKCQNNGDCLVGYHCDKSVNICKKNETKDMSELSPKFID